MIEDIYQSFFTTVSDFVYLVKTIEVLQILLVGFGMMLLAAMYRGRAKVFNKKALAGIAATIALFIANIFIIPFVMMAVDGLQALLDSYNIARVSNETWSSLPFVLVAAIAIFLGDFIDYWNHRFMHMKWIWPVHAVHHSDHELNAFTTFRVHALEVLIMRTSHVIGLAWLGLPAEAVGFAAILFTFHNMYVHTDVDWNHGPLKYVIASPRFHSWHHADFPEAFGKNLANVFPFFDVMFGTYYVPSKCDHPMGAQGVPHADVVGLLAYPVSEWSRMAKPHLKALQDGDDKEEPVIAAE